MGRTRWLSTIGLLGLLLLGALSAFVQQPATRAADAPSQQFSGERAMEHIERVAAEPRTLGSTQHAETRRYLLEQLETWGWNTEVHRSVGATNPDEGTRQLAAVSNVLATLPGTDPTGTVVLAAHYDSVAASPGAADDGIGMGTLLETARALSATETAPRNNVTILITDAEELGLLGAEAFVRDRADQLGTTVLLNHEARGNEGVPTTFRTTSPNAVLLEVLSLAPGTVADSAFEAVFEALPNDTDVTRFTEGGLHSYDTAITGGGAYYHSPLDTPENLSDGSLQQMGIASLTMTRDLAGRDLATVPRAGNDLVTTLPWGQARYPQAAEAPLAWVMLALAAAVVGLARWRRALTLPRTVISAVVTLVALAAAGLAAFAVWQVASTVEPGQASAVVGVPYTPGPYQVAMLLAGFGVLVGTYALLRRRLGAEALAAGGLLTFALLAVLATLTLPGLSSLLVPPTFPVVLGALITAVMPRKHTVGRVVVTLLALVPAAVLLAPGAVSAFEVDLALGGVLGTVLFAIAVWLALPVFENLWSSDARRSWWRSAALPALGLTLVAALIATGLVANRPGATPPRQQQLLYSIDADADTAYWATSDTPDSDWSRSLLPEQPAVLDDAFPWVDGEPLAHGPAPIAAQPGPRLEVVADRGDPAGTRELTLRLSSPREAAALGLWVDAEQATVRSATVAGRSVTGTEQGEDFGFVFHGAPSEGIEVQLVLTQHADTLPVRIADRGHDLTQVPGFTPPDGLVLVRPISAVTRTQTL
ncbi:M28 family peptidase [Allosaccharopolyspora coralli]|uniref:M28 family peptidase n=1 Tax=Allosaccharopolyspora coralli TaxID=2665642 RepID=A0A5Q3Q9S2_9PSEU|nr:M28 family peptidase [Allosaccharopolyspora coralli]QGK69954.1 M28 family peptidase [Allosaccharopolyspora coralli]